ncbi:MAG: hypothetical protein RLO52_29125 [Sandaracinaceae bacterium]|nr:MAG: hypothetical protein EVA89_04635 [Sandaracinaceae bacterium]
MSEWDPKWGPPPPPPDEGPAPRFHVPQELDAPRQPTRAKRPALVDAFALGMAASTLSGLFVSPGTVGGSAHLYGAGCGLVLGLGVTWFFWMGRSWAYWLVVLGSVLSLSGFAVWLAPVELTFRLSPTWKTKMVADACFGAVMLIGLSRGSVRAFFRGPPGSRDPRTR